MKASHGSDARFLAGGQSLVPTMNFRLAQPSALIDLNDLADLAGVNIGADGSVRIAAMTRNSVIEKNSALMQVQSLVTEAIAYVAHPQIRNRGTLGGNLSHADPASEMPAVMLALDASLELRSQRGSRTVSAQAFFQGVFTTALADDEMLAAIDLPALPARTGTCFMEVARRHGDYAMMGVAAVVTLAANGRCANARLAFCSAGETPRLAPRAMQLLAGQMIDDSSARAAAATARGELDPMGSVHASIAYQRHLAGVLARRALLAATDRAQANSVGAA